MSFDVCIKYYDEVVDSIPSLPLNSKIMTTRDTGHPEEYDKMSPEDSRTPVQIQLFRKHGLWPTLSTYSPLLIGGIAESQSDFTVADQSLALVMTEANQQLWPILTTLKGS